MKRITDLVPINHSDQRVLTTAQLAEVYGTTPARLRDNFHYARKHFVEGVDFFKVTGLALRQLKSRLSEVGNSDSAPIIPKAANAAILWTEKGCVRHCKMLNTQAAWDMFNELQRAYFNQSPVESTVDAAALDDLRDELAELRYDLDGLKITFAEMIETYRKIPSAMERADKLIVLADKTTSDDDKDRIIRAAANLLAGKKLF